MKKIFLLAVCLMAMSLRAEHNSPAVRTKASNRPKAEGTREDLLRCVRDSIEQDLGGTQGLTRLMHFIQLAQLNAEPVGRAVEACRQFRGSQTSQETTAQEYLQALETLKTREAPPENVVEVLKGFIKPTIECRKVGLQLGVALIVNVEAKQDLAYCRSTNGRRWMEYATGIGGGLGLGGLLSVNSGKLSRQASSDDYWGTFFSKTQSISVYVRTAQGGNDGLIKAESTGAGLGALASWAKFGEGHMPFLPFPEDMESVSAKLSN